MFGFFIGAAVLLGVARFTRHRRGCGRGHHHHHGGWRARRRHRRDQLEHLTETLGLDEEQEDMLAEQAKLLRKRVRSMAGEVGKTRGDLARAMRAPSFDENIVGEMYARHDDVIRLLRLELVERLATIHERLDEGQRERLAELFESGRGYGGPFRGGW